MPSDGDLKHGAERFVRAQDDGRGRLRRARRRQRLLPRHSQEQERRPSRSNRKSASQKSEDITERLIGEYEARLHNEPNNLKLVRSLAELYTQKKQFDRALELYERIKRSDMGNDPSLDQRHRRTPSSGGSTIQIAAAQSLRAGPRRAGGENQGREARLSARRMPEARGEIPDRPRHPVSRWACSIFSPAKSARPSPNCRRRRATRTSASPR